MPLVLVADTTNQTIALPPLRSWRRISTMKAMFQSSTKSLISFSLCPSMQLLRRTGALLKLRFGRLGQVGPYTPPIFCTQLGSRPATRGASAAVEDNPDFSTNSLLARHLCRSTPQYWRS